VEAYTIKEIVILMNILMIRHELSCTLQKLKSNNKSYIYIKNKSMPLLLRGIRPFVFIPYLPFKCSSREFNTTSGTTIISVKSYTNALTSKKEIIKENQDKVGIYRWVNLSSGMTYLGSSVNLGNRFEMYFNHKFISDPKSGMVIHKALIKYGYSGFKLEIIEYCNQNEVLTREQYYLDLLKPEYNILKKAGSSLGFKHTDKTRALMSNSAKNKKAVSEETKAKLRDIAQNRFNTLKKGNRLG
jgi:hypothetical protein